MECTYHNFKNLNIDTTSVALEGTENIYPYFCYPLNAKPIGLEGCILYCFIDGYGDMVFASNPESCAETNVYPLAYSFCDFMRLVIACGSANPVEQIVWMTKEQFEQHLENEKKIKTEIQKNTLNTIKTAFDLTPMENPYEYVKGVQKDFNGDKIRYSDEYYDVSGIQR